MFLFIMIDLKMKKTMLKEVCEARPPTFDKGSSDYQFIL
jgi:hypothetical protein